MITASEIRILRRGEPAQVIRKDEVRHFQVSDGRVDIRLAAGRLQSIYCLGRRAAEFGERLRSLGYPTAR